MMHLFKNRETRRANHPSPDLPVQGQVGPTPEDELGFLGLVSERHRADHELRHDYPLTPDHFFTPDPHPARADIA